MQKGHKCPLSLFSIIIIPAINGWATDGWATDGWATDGWATDG